MNSRRRKLRLPVAILSALLPLGLATTLVLAAETRMLDGKLRAGESVTVPADETVSGDLYIFAGNATVNGRVDEDLIVFGGQIHVNGSVGGDLQAAGGTINISGDVAGDVRIAGGQATVSGAIGEDLVASAGQSTLASAGSVEGDLIVSGGQVSVVGNVAGNIQGTAGAYDRTGTVGGTEIVQIQSTGDAEDPADAARDQVTDALRHFIVLLIIGAVLLLLLPRVVRRPEETLRAEPVLSLGGGFLAWIGLIIFVIALVLIVVLLAILFGLLQLGVLAAVEVVAGILTLGAVGFLFWIALAFLADIVVGLALARLVVRDDPTRPMQPSRWRELGLLAAGALVVVILTSLPVVGGIAKLLGMLLGLGAMAVAAWRWWRGRGAVVVASPPADAAPSPPPA